MPRRPKKARKARRATKRILPPKRNEQLKIFLNII